MRERVQRSREVQRARYSRVPNVACNAHAPARLGREAMDIRPDALRLLADAAERLGFTARAYHRVLRVARTIADLDEDRAVCQQHVAEALRYRPVS